MSTTPNLLLGAGLIFWGWQTGFPLLGVLMAVTLELRHLLKDRWDLGEEDFTRIWVFCVVLFVTAGVYAFTSNEGPAGVISFFREPGFATQRSAGLATARSAAALLRWLPMVFLPLIAAELYSTGRGIPLESISLFLRRRKRLAQKFGEVLPPARRVSSFYPYFGICLFSGSIRPNLTEDQTYFYGMGVLMAWALVQSRSPRYPRLIWAFTLAVAMFIAYVGQYELGQAQRYLENINPTWLVSPGRRGFDPKQTRTMIGQVGRLKLSGNIVIRLQTPPNSKAPPLLREASYRIYRSPIWSLGNTASQFEPVQGEPDGLTWVLAISPTNGTQVNIASYLPGGTGLLPLPGGSVRLENLPAFGLQKSDTGSVLAQGPGLVIFDALPGRGGTIDAPPDTLEDYLVPGREKYALRQVIDEAHLAGLGRAETLQAIQRFFEARFSYRTWQVPFGRRGITNETALGRFLLKDRSGHCEYFATATVLLLRELKIPARYAVGYAVHEHSGNGYVVRQRDAHAWCLVE